MKKFKRIVAFMLATVILASLCLVNTGAAGSVFINFGGTEATRRFFPNGTNESYAYVRITNWAMVENDTDLEAQTCAYGKDYDTDDCISIEVYAHISVLLDDMYSTDRTSATATGTPNDVSIITIADGKECLNYDDHYGIQEFTTTHTVYITTKIYTNADKTLWYQSEPMQDGPCISIGTTS